MHFIFEARLSIFQWLLPFLVSQQDTASIQARQAGRMQSYSKETLARAWNVSGLRPVCIDDCMYSKHTYALVLNWTGFHWVLFIHKYVFCTVCRNKWNVSGQDAVDGIVVIKASFQFFCSLLSSHLPFLLCLCNFNFFFQLLIRDEPGICCWFLRTFSARLPLEYECHFLFVKMLNVPGNHTCMVCILVGSKVI